MNRSNLLTFPIVCFLLFGVCTLTGPSRAQEADASSSAWSELPRPDVGKGLMMEPHLLGFGSRIHLVWIGTTGDVPKPEVFHTSISGGSTEWTNPRAPYFGLNKGRVRRIAIGRARSLIGIFFQRTLTQGNDAYECLLSISSDQGWGWSKPQEIDSFVSDRSGGTWVDIDGRQAPNRTDFALAWSRDFNNLRFASMDITSSLRPEGVVVGQHDGDAMKCDIGSLGKDGFSLVYNNGVGLATAHAKALNGKVEEGTTFLKGRYGMFFSVASRTYGGSRMVVGDNNKIMAFTANGESWKNDDQNGVLPFSASGVEVASDTDDDKNLHVVMVVPKDQGYELWYIGQKDMVWGEAERIAVSTEDLEMRGFDIGVTDDYIFVAASQGFDAKYYRRKLKS